MDVRGAMTMVLGIAECAYYINHMASGHEQRGNILVNIVMGREDVTFGCAEKLKAAFKEMMEEYNPEAVFLVTTCVPEVTGEDVELLAKELCEHFDIPIGVVHTEHFRSGVERAGTANAISAFDALMKTTTKNSSVNILGQNSDDFYEQELFSVLREANVKPGIFIPGSSAKELKKAAGAKLNIVTDGIALSLAKRMKKKLGIPYISLEPHIYPQIVLDGYKNLFDFLKLPLPNSVTKAYKEACGAVIQTGASASGLTYFLGRSDFPLFELNAFLTEQKMFPLLMRVHGEELTEDEQKYKDLVLTRTNPYVYRDTEAEDLDKLKNQLHPDLLVGMDTRRRRSAKTGGFRGIVRFLMSLCNEGAGENRRGHIRRQQDETDFFDRTRDRLDEAEHFNRSHRGRRGRR
jgi:nitrogenase molybdenum-cofactor synthesis protein NifE